MAAEHGDSRRRGFWTSWTQAGVPLGNLLSAGVLWALALFQSDESFDAWGWRIPFLLSALLVLIGLWIRLSIEESPVFAANKKALESHESEHAPIIEVLRKYPREVLIAMGLRMVENTAYYIFTIVVMTYMVTYLDLPKSAAIAGVLIASVGQFFLTPLVGALSDRIGRRPLYFTGAVGAGIWGFVFFPLIDTENPTIIAAAIFIGLIFTTLMYAPQAAMFSELFGTSVRYSGASLGYQLASVFAGGLAPFIAVSLLGTVEERNTLAVSIYLAILAVITVTAVFFAKETAGSSLEHDRVLDEALHT